MWLQIWWLGNQIAQFFLSCSACSWTNLTWNQYFLVKFCMLQFWHFLQLNFLSYSSPWKWLHTCSGKKKSAGMMLRLVTMLFLDSDWYSSHDQGTPLVTSATMRSACMSLKFIWHLNILITPSKCTQQLLIFAQLLVT